MMFRNMKRMMSDEEAFATILGMLLGMIGGAFGGIIGIAFGPFNILCGLPTLCGGWVMAHIGAAVGVAVGILADVFVPVMAVAAVVMAPLCVAGLCAWQIFATMLWMLPEACHGLLFGTMATMMGK